MMGDVDVDHAVNAAAFGVFINQCNQGLICMSTERVIVDRQVADQFGAEFAAKASKHPMGDARGHIALGSLVNLKAAEQMDALSDDAVAEGAKVVVRRMRAGRVIEATLLDHLTPEMTIYREESFGHADHAREWNRGGHQGRQRHGVRAFSRNYQPGQFSGHGYRKKNRERHLSHQRSEAADEPPMRFGRGKSSGYDRSGGNAVVDEFTDLRSLTIKGPPQHPFEIADIADAYEAGENARLLVSVVVSRT
ncbi:aldehyde dehydrogenase family protein [Bradyrhizobium sp. HKCCYLS20291]|uniref:aldehyde dehydrogenase family protein n=1 Tax=Bradyrhizobium sp. HKCCYLS20291 TaxID=3420766 RepID=UPI003EB6A522